MVPSRPLTDTSPTRFSFFLSAMHIHRQGQPQRAKKKETFQFLRQTEDLHQTTKLPFYRLSLPNSKCIKKTRAICCFLPVVFSGFMQIRFTATAFTVAANPKIQIQKWRAIGEWPAWHTIDLTICGC